MCSLVRVFWLCGDVNMEVVYPMKAEKLLWPFYRNEYLIEFCLKFY